MSDWDPRANEVFLAAAEIDAPDDRTAFLDEACGEDHELRTRVEELLRSHDDAGSFLNNPAMEPAATRIEEGSTDDVTRAGHTTPVDEYERTALFDPFTTGPGLDFLQSTELADRVGMLGPYEVIEVIGRGGMGVVLKAHDPHLDRIVAIKTLAPEYANNPTARKRFAREAQAAAAVAHAHVVTIHAVEPTNEVPYLVMEFVQGQSLGQKLERTGSLDVREILRIGAQIAQGLAAAHEQGLIHRDVKPGNVLLENGVERVKLTDFGLARATDDVAITRTGDIAGTPQYMSPEQAEGRAVDIRSDLFSLGSVLYAMCTGRPPFRGSTAIAVLRQVCDTEPRPIREVNTDIPPWLAEIIDHLLAKDPDHRIQTAAEVARILGEHLAEVQNPSGGGSKPKFERRLPKPVARTRHRAAAVLLPILLVGLVAVLVWTGVIDWSRSQTGTILVKLAPANSRTVLYDAVGNPVAPHASTTPSLYYRFSELEPGTYWVKVHEANDPNDVILWRSVEIGETTIATINVDPSRTGPISDAPVTARLEEMTEDTLTVRICNHSEKPVFGVYVRTAIFYENDERRLRLGWDWGRRSLPPGECRTEVIQRPAEVPPFAGTLAIHPDYVTFGDGEEVWDVRQQPASADKAPSGAEPTRYFRNLEGAALTALVRQVVEGDAGAVVEGLDTTEGNPTRSSVFFFGDETVGELVYVALRDRAMGNGLVVSGERVRGTGVRQFHYEFGAREGEVRVTMHQQGASIDEPLRSLVVTVEEWPANERGADAERTRDN